MIKGAAMLKYQVIDVFATMPFKGNPVAVVFGAEKLTATNMQNIANWINLSETTFILPPENQKADYRLRIFTPHGELPFAGHPTLGSAYAIRQAHPEFKNKQELVQECQKGLISILKDRHDSEKQFLELPPAHFADLDKDDILELENALNISLKNHQASAINVGPVWIVGEIATPQELLKITYDNVKLSALSRKTGALGVTVFASYGNNSGIEVRSFAPLVKIHEDPVCGSGNGAVAAFRKQKNHLPLNSHYIAHQGKSLGRDGLIEIHIQHDGKILVGGRSLICMNGTMSTN